MLKQHTQLVYAHTKTSENEIMHVFGMNSVKKRRKWMERRCATMNRVAHFILFARLFLLALVRFFSRSQCAVCVVSVCRQLIMFAHSRTLIGVSGVQQTHYRHKPCSALLFSHDCHRCRTCSILYCIFVFVSLFITQINCIHATHIHKHCSYSLWSGSLFAILLLTPIQYYRQYFSFTILICAILCIHKPQFFFLLRTEKTTFARRVVCSQSNNWTKVSWSTISWNYIIIDGGKNTFL